MQGETDGKSGWPFHPKYVGAIIAVIFLSALLLTFVYEQTLAVVDTGSFVALRTFLAVFGGSGFTAWLSMTIYEYITRRTQRAGWKHQFDVDKVREVYGPVYNEMRRNLELLTVHFSNVKWGRSHAVFQLQYLSLLVPDHLIRLEKDFEGLADEYNRLHDETVGKLNNRVRSLANSYLADIGGPSDSIKSLSGSESRYLLGGTHPDHTRNFRRFLSDVVGICEKNQVEIDVNELEVWLKSQIRGEPEGVTLLQKHKKLLGLVKEMIVVLEPAIKAPYDV